MRVPTSSATPFPDGKRAALSITFDDSWPTQLDLAVPILDRHEVRATFYVLPTRVRARADEWRRVATTHEIGNHSVVHPVPAGRHGGGDTTLEMYTTARMKDELVRADDAIEAMLGLRPQTFAYPGGYTYVGNGAGTASYVPVVARRYVAGRCYRSEFANDPEWCDLAQVQAAHVDGYDADALVALVAAAIEAGRWLVLVAHEIDGDGPWALSSHALDELCRDVARRPELWVAPVVDVARDLRARRPRRTGAMLRRHLLSGRARLAPLRRKLRARMSSVDFATHADLTGRLRGLVILLDEQLTADQARSAEELVDASEFGVALECLADWLAEDKEPIPDDVRRDFERLSSQMGNADRVMGALRCCPTAGDS